MRTLHAGWLGAHVYVQLALMLALHVRVLLHPTLVFHGWLLPADGLPRPLILGRRWLRLWTSVHALQDIVRAHFRVWASLSCVWRPSCHALRLAPLSRRAKFVAANGWPASDAGRRSKQLKVPEGWKVAMQMGSTWCIGLGGGRDIPGCMGGPCMRGGPPMGRGGPWPGPGIITAGGMGSPAMLAPGICIAAFRQKRS